MSNTTLSSGPECNETPTCNDCGSEKVKAQLATFTGEWGVSKLHDDTNQ